MRLFPLSTLLRVGGLLTSGLLLAYAGAEAMPPPAVTAPAVANPVAARELGRLLFFEPLLSANGKRTCASCHRPQKAFTDHRITARGLRFTTNLVRNTPTVLYAAAQTRFFHDGRAGSLADVIGEVIASPREFGTCYDTVIARLSLIPAYRQQFAAAFGPTAPLTPGTLNAALAAYLTTLAAPTSAYDRAHRGGSPLPPTAQLGEALFVGPAGCAKCHPAPLFRDGRLYATAAGDSLKTPTLRNVAVTMPYRADGSAATLAEVITDGFHQTHAPHRLTPAEVAALLDFLPTLTDTAASAALAPPAALPPSPRWPDRPVGGLY